MDLIQHTTKSVVDQKILFLNEKSNNLSTLRTDTNPQSQMNLRFVEMFCLFIGNIIYYALNIILKQKSNFKNQFKIEINREKESSVYIKMLQNLSRKSTVTFEFKSITDYVPTVFKHF